MPAFSRIGAELAQRLVLLYAEHQTEEFGRIAKALAGAEEKREAVERGLVRIIKGEDLFVDVRTRETAIKVLGILGLATRVEARRELYALFGKNYPSEKLRELAAFEALPGPKPCGSLCSELKLLRTLVFALLLLRDDLSILAATQVANVFGDKLALGKTKGLDWF